MTELMQYINANFMAAVQDQYHYWDFDTDMRSASVSRMWKEHYNDSIETVKDKPPTLFALWCNETGWSETKAIEKFNKQQQEQLKTNGNISEENILKILKHFYPNVEIIEDKYVLNIACNLWDKTKHISDSIVYIKEQLKAEQETEIISFDTIYGVYCKYAKSTASKYVVSKRYFEKYLYNKFAEFIVYDKFITINWINT